jgi:hypothetical protein
MLQMVSLNTTLKRLAFRVLYGDIPIGHGDPMPEFETGRSAIFNPWGPDNFTILDR